MGQQEVFSVVVFRILFQYISKIKFRSKHIAKHEFTLSRASLIEELQFKFQSMRLLYKYLRKVLVRAP